MENEYTNNAGETNDTSYFNKVIAEKLDKGVTQKKTGNLISILTLVVLLVGVIVVSLLLLSTNANIASLKANVKTIDQNVDSIMDDVADLRQDVSDISEWGCENRNSNGYVDPWDPGMGVEKPAIYIYPETEDKPVVYVYGDQATVPVHIELTLKESDMLVVWPEAEQSDNIFSWDLYAAEDGTLYDESNEYSYVFWEAEAYGDHDFSKGFCVAGEDTAEFLRETLSEIGLTPREYNEFIVYWVPRMQGNAYNLITFEGLDANDSYNTNFPLTVTDEDGNAADSMLRVMMAWTAVETPVEIEPQNFTTFVRDGLTVVEWGGTEIR